jgi:hypothetical protein
VPEVRLRGVDVNGHGDSGDRCCGGGSGLAAAPQKRAPHGCVCAGRRHSGSSGGWVRDRGRGGSGGAIALLRGFCRTRTADACPARLPLALVGAGLRHGGLHVLLRQEQLRGHVCKLLLQLKHLCSLGCERLLDPVPSALRRIEAQRLLFHHGTVPPLQFSDACAILLRQLYMLRQLRVRGGDPGAQLVAAEQKLKRNQ